MYPAYADLTHGACDNEVECVEDRRDEVQAYAGPVCPIGRCGRIAQQQIVYYADDDDGDKSAELPLHQAGGDGLAVDEAHQLNNHHSEAVEVT